ncbi:preprotein translocase subunit SecA [Candidatus Gracilibacteria bacterium]|nr:preprotein translocase subunit SecA [Candidatus Gracilibacteria bacterium]MCF7898831.1 preprotein translocase subunit SecA [Candidatus Paceibacterota bacterium]
MSLISQSLKLIFPDESIGTIKKLTPIVDAVFSHEEALKTLSDHDLKHKSLTLKEKVMKSIEGLKGDELKQKEKEVLEEVLPEAFALVREASRRTLKMMHYRVQVIGGILLHRGHIAEMRTGEGKTLVATLPSYLNALTGRGVHIVTVNDYLSRRDAVWMGQIHDALGLSVSVINNQSSFMYDSTHLSKKELEKDDAETKEVGAYKVVYDFLNPCGRQEAYRADITYGTNNEFGFDYLRDNIGYSSDAITQHTHHYAIVDEIDSILIDEARTPLIISAPAAESSDMYMKFAGIAENLVEGDHYTVDEKQRAISLTEEGINKVEAALGISNIYSVEGMKYVHHLETSVKAKALFLREREYVVKDGQVIIVDEFTGRMQPGRRWSDGIHQAVEAKEGVKIEQESRTLASITFQNYFRFYEKLSGMTGTAETSKEEFYKVYGLVVTPIPTHNPIHRKDHADFIFQTEKGKWKALAKKVKELNDKGQPVLIGTISIEKNEEVSEYLRRANIPHTILNAKNHEKEGEIIAAAGKKSAVTIATNMAGRGVDIKLGGPQATESEREDVLSYGGLFVIGTERHEARRIDNQLRGRSGRQGDVGETQFFVSLEDDLMRVFGSSNIKNMMGRFGIPEDEPVSSKMVSRALEGAQEKIEGFHFDTRKHTLQYDDVLNHQRTSVYTKRRKILFNDEAFVDEVIAELVLEKPELEEVMKQKEKQYEKEAVRHIFRVMMLQVIDTLWMEHLDAMEHLRNSVNLRAYGQRDPLVEYKKEGLRMFKGLEASLRAELILFIENMDGFFASQHAQAQVQNNFVQVIPETAGSNNQDLSTRNVGGEKFGRNDPCPCGSGKKVKKCDCAEYLYLRH